MSPDGILESFRLSFEFVKYIAKLAVALFSNPGDDPVLVGYRFAVAQMGLRLKNSDSQGDESICLVDQNRRLGIAESFCNENEDSENDEETISYQKSAEERDFLRISLQSVLFCSQLKMEQMNLVIDAMSPVKVEQNEVIMKQGEKGDMFYIIKSGRFEVSKDNVVVHVFDNSGYFGELALIYAAPRSATVTSTVEGWLWSINRRNFRRLVVNSVKKRDKMYETTLDSIPLFNGLDWKMKDSIICSMVQVTFNDGDCIIKEGEDGDCMYFVESGEVRFESQSKTKILNICKAGDYFGELALINKEPRAVSAFAIGKIVLGVLNAENFEHLMAPLLDTLEKNKSKYYNQSAEHDKSCT